MYLFLTVFYSFVPEKKAVYNKTESRRPTGFSRSERPGGVVVNVAGKVERYLTVARTVPGDLYARFGQRRAQKRAVRSLASFSQRSAVSTKTVEKPVPCLTNPVLSVSIV